MEMRVALITGASSGIGAELSRELCRRGYRVIGIARSVDRLRRLADELGKCFVYHSIDLLAQDAVDRVEAVARDVGGIDVLVNNAGGAMAKQLVRHEANEIEELFKLNAVRPLQITARLIRYIRRGGVVVNVITAGIFVEMTSMPIYGAAKSALHYATRILRRELSDAGIAVIAVYPGPVKTEFFTRAGASAPSKALDPRRVAQAIAEAIESRRSVDIYLPWYARFLALLAPWPLRLTF